MHGIVRIFFLLILKEKPTVLRAVICHKFATRVSTPTDVSKSRPLRVVFQAYCFSILVSCMFSTYLALIQPSLIFYLCLSEHASRRRRPRWFSPPSRDPPSTWWSDPHHSASLAKYFYKGSNLTHHCDYSVETVVTGTEDGSPQPESTYSPNKGEVNIALVRLSSLIL